MKKLALAVVAAAAFTGSAGAADMPARAYTKAPPPPPVAVANWTGCYVGGGGGYGLWNQENTLFADPPLVAVRTQASATATAGGRGYFGTVQGGCDYQFSMASWQVVVGAFGDYDFASIKGQLNQPGTVLFGQEKLTDQWAVGGRIGVLVTPQLLTYFTAGYTEAKFGHVNFETIAGVPAVLVPGFGTSWNSRWYKGWFLGAGDEYALSFLPGLFWKTEYRFSHLDRETNANFFAANSVVGPPNTPTGFSVDSEKWVHTVRSELVYRFNWGGPLVAKY
jgi:outer membrane immunogenic protein